MKVEMKKVVLFLISMLTSVSVVSSQESKLSFLSDKANAIELRLMDESMAFPYPLPKLYAFNPALYVGAEMEIKEFSKGYFYIQPSMISYYHKSWEAAILAQLELGYKHNWKRISLSPRMGAGYGHIIPLAKTYTFQVDQFEQTRNWGDPKFIATASLNLAVPLNQNGLELVLSAMQSFHFPFNDYLGFHQFIGAGIRIPIIKN